MTLSIILFFILFLISGCITGILSALFGAGGGIIVVPILFLVFHIFDHLPSDIVMHAAIGTSMAVMIITTLNSVYKHYKLGNMVSSVIKPMGVWVGIGVVFGIIIAHFLHSHILKTLFIIMLIGVFLQALFKKDFTQTYELKDFSLPKKIWVYCVSLFIGCIAVLVGIGGSVISVPFLRNCKMPMKNASACAVALTPIVAILGSIGYLISGLHYTGQLPADCIGFINIPAFIGLSIGTLFGVPMGAKLSMRIQDKLLARSYLVLLLVIIVVMLV